MPCDGVLAAEVEVPALASGREASDGHRLDDRERIVLDHHTIFERARLALVGVGDEVVRCRCVRRNRLPLAARRERGAATTDEAAARDFGDDGGRADLDRLAQRVVATVRLVRGERRRVDDARPREEDEPRLPALRH